MAQASQVSESRGWFSWMSASNKPTASRQGDASKIGYDRMDDSCHVTSPAGSEMVKRPARAESVYGCGYSTYQMAPAPDGQEYDLQLKRKDRKPRVNSLWARIKYWLQYTWKMFKVGLMASGPGMSAGPMMAPPPMASMTSRTTRHRVAKEGPVPDVFM
ncbi:hypothetical protein EGW08_013541 [Elysia chlorotica]|uniref:Uncharacterized protein n=1 Tax=Elysia chlorotica TaxID=188477 RepID=A0A3S1BA16_ELYCH|nr:hypothetical protein EGW08_013541 [Elysia chlorotica]